MTVTATKSMGSVVSFSGQEAGMNSHRDWVL